MKTMYTYISRSQNIVARYIVTQPILDLCIEVEYRLVLRFPKLVVTRILKFSQRNGKLPLPQLKQDN